MKTTVIAAVTAILSMTSIADAGFESWTTDTESDPFSGGMKITASYFVSLRTGVLFMCDTSKVGLTVRAVPGYVYEAHMLGYSPIMEFAIDGEVLPGGEGTVGSVGDNLAAVDITISGDAAQTLLDKFAGAKRQIAVKDGMSDLPYLMKARGSTKAGQALSKCLVKSPAAGVSPDLSSSENQTGMGSSPVTIRLPSIDDQIADTAPPAEALTNPTPEMAKFIDAALRAVTYSKVCFDLNVNEAVLKRYAVKHGGGTGVMSFIHTRFDASAEKLLAALPIGDRCAAGRSEFGAGGTVLPNLLDWRRS